ncbi:PEGA domain-containing protein [Candidatus Gottesmanbacteria bacterium]|nr:PEGA domain-containing protein [Candidatus Gottesmanbacteria bacterium]
MRRKVIFLLITLLLIGAVIGLTRFLGGRTGTNGELRVDSQPTASVFLDNKHIGRSPYKDKVPAGEYTIKLTPESMVDSPASWQGRIIIGPSLLTYVNATLSDSELTSAVDVLWLEKISGKSSEISVTTNPDGATLLIDNETKGITPLSLSDIPAGDHALTVTSPGFAPRTLKIKTTSGYRLIVTVKLALSGEPPPAGGPTPTEEATPSPTLKATPKATPTKIATSSASMPDPTKPFVTIKDTPVGFLRVRKEPSTSSEELGRVNPGEKYHIEDEQNGWYQILYSGSNEGWISGQYATKTE